MVDPVAANIVNIRVLGTGDSPEIRLGDGMGECAVRLGSEAGADRKHAHVVQVLRAGGEALRYKQVHVLRTRGGVVPGDLPPPVFSDGLVLWGLQIGEDMWFPEGARSLTVRGALGIVHFAAVCRRCTTNRQPEPLSEDEMWILALRARAYENTVFVVTVSGGDLGLPVGKVWDPAGFPVEPRARRDGEVAFSLDLGLIDRERGRRRYLDARRPECYGLLLQQEGKTIHGERLG